MSLNSLYQEIIIDHYKNPRNFGKLDDPEMTGHFTNPSCGDEIDIQVILNEDGYVEDIKFSGRGCAISQASASMMTELVKGKSIAEIKQEINDFQDFMTGKTDLPPSHEDLESLEGVKSFPLRIKCATLAWSALSDVLTKAEQNREKQKKE